MWETVSKSSEQLQKSPKDFKIPATKPQKSSPLPNKKEIINTTELVMDMRLGQTLPGKYQVAELYVQEF